MRDHATIVDDRPDDGVFRLHGDARPIARKTIVLQNEHVPTVLDIYCV